MAFSSPRTRPLVQLSRSGQIGRPIHQLASPVSLRPMSRASTSPVTTFVPWRWSRSHVAGLRQEVDHPLVLVARNLDPCRIAPKLPSSCDSRSRQSSISEENIRSATPRCRLSPEIIVQLPPRDHVGAVLDRPLELQLRVHEDDLRDDVIADERLGEGQAMLVEILHDRVLPLPVGLEHVRVLHDLTIAARLAPDPVPDVQPARPVLDLDQVDHLGRADDQVDLAPTPLAFRGDAPPGEEVGRMGLEGRSRPAPSAAARHPARP